MEKYNPKFAKQLTDGERAEIENMGYIEDILGLKLKSASKKNRGSHFDYKSKDKTTIAELKDRIGLMISKNGNVVERKRPYLVLDTLFFDKCKLDYARGHPEFDAYIVWKVGNEFFVWKVNHNYGKDYYIESDWNHDFGIGTKRPADVVNVFIDKCERYEIIS